MAYKCNHCYRPLKVVELELCTVRPGTMSVVRREKTVRISCPECGEISKPTNQPV